MWLYQATVGGVREKDVDDVRWQHRQCINEVRHVESDLEIFARVFDLELVFRCLLLGVVRRDVQGSRAKRQPNRSMLVT